MAVGGSLRKVTINGVTYNVVAETDATENPPFQVEMDEHSGGSTPLVTRQNATVEGIELSVDGIDQENLIDLADPQITPEDYSMSYVEADGTVKSAAGRINIDSRSTANSRITISMMPTSGRWKVFSP